MSERIPYGKEPGCWQRVLWDEFSDKPRWGAVVCCPNCKRWFTLYNHAISPEGVVSPSIGHPTGWQEDGWHPNATLEGWSPCPPAPAPHPMNTCAKCGTQSRALGGWGVVGNHDGVVCGKCFAEIVRPK